MSDNIVQTKPAEAFFNYQNVGYLSSFITTYRQFIKIYEV